MHLSINRIILFVILIGMFALYFIGNFNGLFLWIMPGVLLLCFSRFRYYDPIFVFVAPWFLIQIFSLLEISAYSKPLSQGTILLLFTPAIVSSILFPIYMSNITTALRSGVVDDINETFYADRFTFFTMILVFIFIINTVVSGFLPIINVAMGLDSQYKEYGIKSVNGLFNALLNTYAIFCAFLYFRSGCKRFLLGSAGVIFVFVCVYSRQNIITFLIELLVIYTFCVKPISSRRVILFALFGLMLFSFLGTLRSGSISNLMKVNDDWLWLPEFFFWVFGYSYFNALNLNVVVVNHLYGYYDGSSLFGMLPSIIRPDLVQDAVPLPLANLNVSSYITPLFRDGGYLYVYMFTFLILYISVKCFNRAVLYRNFKSVAIYSVLFYCLLFSFFVNFWLYLPVISQIVFILVLNRFILKAESSDIDNCGNP